jgi:small-conductance mechanosensitive channel
LEPFVQKLLVFGGTFAVLMVLRQLTLVWLRRQAAGPETVPHLVAGRLRIPTLMWCLAGALDAAIRYAQLTDNQEHEAHVWIVLFMIASLTLVSSALLLGVIEVYSRRRHVPFVVAGLSRTLIRVLVFSIGVLSMLRFLGIPVTPMLATLGVGGLAVALALQDTLANFFAGVHILVENPIAVGNHIQLTDDQQGIVTDIGWRTTRLITGTNNTIVIPNKKITSEILTNFDLPDLRVVAELTIVADQDTDPELVRNLALKAVAETEGPLSDPGPILLMEPGVTPTHLQMKLLFSVPSRRQAGLIKSNVNYRLNAELRANGVKFPRATR